MSSSPLSGFYSTISDQSAYETLNVYLNVWVPHPAQGPEPQNISPCPSKATAGLVSLPYPAQPWPRLTHGTTSWSCLGTGLVPQSDTTIIGLDPGPDPCIDFLVWHRYLSSQHYLMMWTLGWAWPPPVGLSSSLSQVLWDRLRNRTCSEETFKMFGICSHYLEDANQGEMFVN